MTHVALTYDGTAPLQQLAREGFVLDRHFTSMGVIYGTVPTAALDALWLVDGVRVVAPAPVA